MNQPSVEPEYMVESEETLHMGKPLVSIGQTMVLAKLERLLEVCNLQVDISRRIRDSLQELEQSLGEQQ